LSEKHIFHIRHLHLGHLAKAFALREAPKSITGTATVGRKAQKKKDVRSNSTTNRRPIKIHQPPRIEGVDSTRSAEKRMQDIVRAQGRLSKKGGVMMSSGVSEFQIAGRDALEKLVHGS
jgi:ATP-dependent RNA helicase DDX31/DBP7